MTGTAAARRRSGETAGVGRWAISLVVVLAAHFSLGLGLVAWPGAQAPVEPPGAVVLIDFAAPGMAAMAAEGPPSGDQAESTAAPEPESLAQLAIAAAPPEPVRAVPERPEPEPAEPLLPEPLAEPIPEPEITVPQPRTKPPAPVSKPRMVRPTKLKAANPAPAAVPPTTPTAVAGATPGASGTPSGGGASSPGGAASGRAAWSWQGALVAHLERHKHYPRAARMRHAQGVARLRFTVDRRGRVLAYALERSSGHPMLDEETLALIRRAEPLPPMPPDMPQHPVELVVPLVYALR
ncbi:MAG: TonB family protein [Azospirillum sp.]|nr:TonB family protein [Azospirillum sp.]